MHSLQFSKDFLTEKKLKNTAKLLDHAVDADSIGGVFDNFVSVEIWKICNPIKIFEYLHKIHLIKW